MAQSSDRDIDAETSAFLWPPTVDEGPVESRTRKTPGRSTVTRVDIDSIVSPEPDSTPRIVPASIESLPDADTIRFDWPLPPIAPDAEAADAGASANPGTTARNAVATDGAVVVASKAPWRRAAPADWSEDEWTEDEGWPLEEEPVGPPAIAPAMPTAEPRMRKPMVAAALLALAGVGAWAVVTRYGDVGWGQSAIRARTLPVEITALAPVVADNTPLARAEPTSRETGLERDVVDEEDAVPAGAPSVALAAVRSAPTSAPPPPRPAVTAAAPGVPSAVASLRAAPVGTSSSMPAVTNAAPVVPAASDAITAINPSIPAAASPPPTTAVAETVMAASTPPPRPAPSRDVERAPVPDPPAPTPPPAAAATTTARESVPDTEQIVSVLRRFQLAYRELDAAAAKQIWPSVDQRALERAFQNLVSQDVAFDACDLSVTGDDADAACRATTTYVARIGNREPRTLKREWNFRLRKVENGWTITRAEAREAASR